jgi:hypothetical protein
VNWINDVLEDSFLAETIAGLKERHELTKAVKERRDLLWSHLR